MCVPSTYFIGEAGVPLEVTGGHVSPEDFHKKIEEVLKVKYQKGTSLFAQNTYMVKLP